MVHGAAVAVLYALSISLWLKGFLAGVVLLSLVVELGRARRAVRLLWMEEGEWKIQIGERPSLSGKLLPDTLISRFGALLIFRIATGGRVAVVALPDAFTGDGLRQLRVRLRIEPPRSPPALFPKAYRRPVPTEGFLSLMRRP